MDLVLNKGQGKEFILPHWSDFVPSYAKGDLFYRLSESQDGTTVAYAILKIYDSWIKIVVLQTRQDRLRRGYGSTLLKSILSDYADSAITLECQSSFFVRGRWIFDPSSLNFWSKHGFVWFGNSSNGDILIKCKDDPLLVFETTIDPTKMFYTAWRKMIVNRTRWSLEKSAWVSTCTVGNV